jgi:hypothetical protein
MSINGAGTRFLSPRETIESGLPELLIGKPRIETATSSSLKHLFVGTTGRWTNFTNDVSTFYNTEALHDAFTRGQDIGTSIDLESLRQKWPHFSSLEHTYVAEERDLQARFLNNVMDPVAAVVKTLHNAKIGFETERDKLKAVLPHDIQFGSSKIVPVADREINEPDIVVKIPVMVEFGLLAS